MELQSNLPVLLAQRKMKAKDLAAQLNTSDTVVSNWANNRNYPKIQTLYMLAKILECTVDELYTITE